MIGNMGGAAARATSLVENDAGGGPADAAAGWREASAADHAFARKPKKPIASKSLSLEPRPTTWAALRETEPELMAMLVHEVQRGKLPRSMLRHAFPGEQLGHVLAIDWRAQLDGLARRPGRLVADRPLDGPGAPGLFQSIIDVFANVGQALRPFEGIDFGTTVHGLDLSASAGFTLLVTENVTFTITGDDAFSVYGVPAPAPVRVPIPDGSGRSMLDPFLHANDDGSYTISGGRHQTVLLSFSAAPSVAIGRHGAMLHVEGDKGTKLSFHLHASLVSTQLVASATTSSVEIGQGGAFQVDFQFVSQAIPNDVALFRLVEVRRAGGAQAEAAPGITAGPVFVQADGHPRTRQFGTMKFHVAWNCPVATYRCTIEASLDGAKTRFTVDVNVTETLAEFAIGPMSAMDVSTAGGKIILHADGHAATFISFRSNASAWYESVHFWWTLVGTADGQAFNWVQQPQSTLRIAHGSVMPAIQQNPAMMWSPQEVELKVSEDFFPAIGEGIAYLFDNIGGDGNGEVGVEIDVAAGAGPDDEG
jgi:hypothetical protein